MEEEPKWFIKFRENDYKHFKDQVARIEILQYIILGAIITGAISLIVAGLLGKL